MENKSIYEFEFLVSIALEKNYAASNKNKNKIKEK